MRILVGMPDKSSLGGPIYCEPPFVVALRSSGVEVDEEVYVYGDSGTAASFFERVSRVLGAARRLRARTRQKQYDVVQVDPSSPITERYDVLLAVQPSSLTPDQLTNFIAAVKSVCYA